MKKIIKIVFINIIIISLILIISNIIISRNVVNISNFYRDHNISNKMDTSKINIENCETEKYTAERLSTTDKLYNQFCGEDRVKFGINYTKKPIVIFGCSYAYGHGLKREETFPYKLSEITKRPVYSFASCGSNAIRNLIEVEKFIKNDEQNKKVINEAEYYIYLYMHDHIDRYLEIDNLMEGYYKIFSIKNKYLKQFIDIPIIRLIFCLYQIHKISMGGVIRRIIIINSLKTVKNI